ncbi:uncharacterized protein LOC129572631 [Sitodiplosis mosellana]|uniref:uncharacterized protein LOC129572631 n=1 Tax=Sitodiplosis mosellana TaxID=263140 RepID=UPI002443FB79|nr:uncharacterized protein LOC129572631 [Sitodiplosis mosellana]
MSKEEEEITKREYRPPTTKIMSLNQRQWLARGNIPLIDRYGAIGKIVRITAYVLKAIPILLNALKKGAKKPEVNTSEILGSLTPKLLTEATIYWIKYTQLKYFSPELEALKRKDVIKSTSNLLRVNPFLDAEGIMRVKGRLTNLNVTYDERHPIILPAKSSFTKRSLEEAHKEMLHGNIQSMLHYVQTKYWVIGARKAAANVAKSCVKCRRYANTERTQLMSHLPEVRLSNSRPFANCGVDYFGPIQVKRFEGRCKSIDIGYGAVFVCLSTKMVHIECVSNLTTERFLWALARLASIYQMPKEMRSDNGKTFIGAKNELCDVLKTWKSGEISDWLNSKGVQWKFITPRAPHHGGMWESAVKSAKYHMKRLLCNQILTFERYQTLFAKITAVLNSRSLVPLSDEPSDLNYLTPAHAVTGERTIQPLSMDLSEIPMNRVKQQRILDKIQQEFWNVWRKEYVSTLQTRYKWNKVELNLEVGDLIILKVDNSPPGVWPLARVIETYPGSDGLVRTVKTKTTSSELVRPITKLVRLHPEEANDTNTVNEAKIQSTSNDTIIQSTTK